MRSTSDTKTSLLERVKYPVNLKRVGFIRLPPLRLLSILRLDAAFTLYNGCTDGGRPAQQAILYLTVTVSTHPRADTDTGCSLTREMASPQGSIAPATPTTTAATSGFFPPETVPPALGVVENQTVIQSPESAIHGAEKAVETMKIYEGAVGTIELVMNVVDPVVGVCTPSPLL